MNFKETVREQVITVIIDRLKEIVKTYGYNTNCGQNVIRARKSIDPDELPAIVVWPLNEEAEKKYGQMFCTMEFKIESLKKFESENPSIVAEQMLGDMINAMTYSPISPLIEDITYTSGGLNEYPDAGELVVSSFTTFNVKYSFLTGNPYCQMEE
ncbi:MAG: hypothetical protein HQK78_03295 [Desulfobacterales bacterium]|nr:hypothetical protein [Desulfobacterales bacterium]